MRIVTWNCRIGGFRRKAAQIAPLMPDILAVQEVEPIETVLLFAGEAQPTFRDRATNPAYPRRSIGMFSYTKETRLRAVDAPDPDTRWTYGFRRYKASHGGFTFHVAAVWTYPAKPREHSYRQVHIGLEEHTSWIRKHPTVLLGDFNSNAGFRGGNWTKLAPLLDSLALVSAYHHYFGEPFGKETRATHFHRGKEKSRFHIDYCFLPKEWVQHISRVQVGDYRNWSKLSDHVPLIVDLDLPIMSQGASRAS